MIGMNRITKVIPLLIFVFFMGNSAAQNQNSNKIKVYIGSHSTGPNIGITVFEFDTITGVLANPHLATETAAPSFLAIPTSGEFLYSCNSLDSYNDKPEGALSAFKIDPKAGSLILINQKYSGGMNPCHISLDKTNRYAFIANYSGGSIAVFSIETDGSLGTQTAFFQHTGNSINQDRQEKAHAHCIKADPSNKFILAADLGTDKLFVYQFNATDGSLQPNKPAFATLKHGAGPRHFSFHNNGKWLYLANELNCTVSVFNWNSENGQLTEIQNTTTLPAHFAGSNTVAEILVHPNGKFLYCSNRGHNSLAIYSINENTGKITFIEHVPSQGDIPRNFEFDPSGKWMIVTNHGSDNAVIFSVNANTGHLTKTGEIISIPNPFCVRFLNK